VQVDKVDLVGRDDTHIDFAARRFVRMRICGWEKQRGVDASWGKGYE